MEAIYLLFALFFILAGLIQLAAAAHIARHSYYSEKAKDFFRNQGELSALICLLGGTAILFCRVIALMPSARAYASLLDPIQICIIFLTGAYMLYARRKAPKVQLKAEKNTQKFISRT